MANWSTAKWCLVLSGYLFVLGGGLLFYILRKQGKVRQKTQEEIRDRVLNDDITDMPTYSVGGPGAGVAVEATMTSDTLRHFARRGEWGLFWAWPCFLFSWFMSAQLLTTAIALSEGFPIVAWAAGLLCVPGGLAGFFMAFSALSAKSDGADPDPTLDAPRTFDRR